MQQCIVAQRSELLPSTRVWESASESAAALYVNEERLKPFSETDKRSESALLDYK